jgi:HPt (histidine-containing phosphotransfer) domain-containing protein
MSTPITFHPDALALLHTLDQSEPGSSARIVRLFIADAPALLSRIELGHERRDSGELNHASHFLRSSALALGATELADAAQRLEHLPPAQYGCSEATNLLAELRVCLRNTLLGLLALSPEL